MGAPRMSYAHIWIQAWLLIVITMSLFTMVMLSADHRNSAVVTSDTALGIDASDLPFSDDGGLQLHGPENPGAANAKALKKNRCL